MNFQNSCPWIRIFTIFEHGRKMGGFITPLFTMSYESMDSGLNIIRIM